MNSASFARLAGVVDPFPSLINRSLVLLAALLVGTAHAATITVDTTADTVDESNDCSLREAVQAANTNTAVDGCAAGDDTSGGDSNSGDIIVFESALAGETIVLGGADNEDANAEGDLDVRASQQGPTQQGLTIQGPTTGDASSITIDGATSDRVFDVPTVFGADFTLSQFRLVDLTVRNGRIDRVEGPAEGGGIRVEPVQTFLFLDNVRVTGNTAITGSGSARGGGVFAGGPFVVQGSALVDNVADGRSAQGGALYHAPLFIPNGGGFLQISGAEVSGNSATSTSNQAFGGGVYFSTGDTSADLNVFNSTLSGNAATAGGVEAQGAGGGLYSSGGGSSVSFANATVAENSVSLAANAADGAPAVGGGFVANGSQVDLVNTLVAQNTASTGPDCADGAGGDTTPGTIESFGYNLVSNGAGCSFGPTTDGDQVGADGVIDAMLGPLGDNGGPTRTHALLPGSPAIDAGNPQGAETGCLATDQRGVARPIDGDGDENPVCDIGAYEAAANQPPTVVQQIGDQTLSLGGGDLTIDLTPVFEDPEGQPLQYTAESDNPDVATATVEGATLIVTAVSAGTATIAVTATDTMGAGRRAEVPISDGGGALNAASGAGGCTLAPGGRTAPDPMLWLLVAAALGWRYRRGWHALRHRMH